jgi:hypothetical protein
MLSDMPFTNHLGLAMRGGSKSRIWICFRKVNHGRRTECLDAPTRNWSSNSFRRRGTAATKVEAKHRIAVEMVNFIIIYDKKNWNRKKILWCIFEGFECLDVDIPECEKLDGDDGKLDSSWIDGLIYSVSDDILTIFMARSLCPYNQGTD